MARIKYIYLLFVFALFTNSLNLLASTHDFVVVIDPGHGGHDPGAKGKKGNEKDINLKVALKVGEMIKNNDDTKLIFTRKTDVFIPLDQRAKIANDAHADLFISIHTNSVANSHSVKGAETYTLGLYKTQENLEVAKRENSVILIEDNYQKRYAGFNPNSSESYIMFEFLQDKNMKSSIDLASHIQSQFKNRAQRIDKGVHQAGFLVLRETSMPSVLVELGYISTPEEENYLLSDDGENEMASCIYNAFLNYKNGIKNSKDKQDFIVIPSQQNSLDNSKIVNNSTTTKNKVTTAINNNINTTALNDNSKVIFKIQIFSANKIVQKNSREFKGLSPITYYKENGLYKYTYAESYDYNEILKIKNSINSKFKDSFIIAFKENEKININEAIREFKNNR